MQILQIILSILSILIILLIFVRPQKGVLLYLIYFFLAPHLIIGSVILGTRTEAILFLLAFLMTTYKKTPSVVYRQLKPFILFFALQVMLIPFSFDPEYSFNSWFVSVSQLIFVVFLGALIYIGKNRCGTNIFTNVFFVIFLIIIGYGLFLTTMPGLNPYQMILQPIFGGSFNEAYAAGQGGNTTLTTLADGRLFGRISSLFSDPQKYALALGLFFIFLFLYIKKKLFLVILLLASGIAIVTSGVRTPIAALGITGLFMLLYYRKYKYFVYSLFVVGILFYIVPLISSDAAEYIGSIVNSNESDTKGSSIEMRISQFEACLDILKNNPLFGNGLGWTNWYIEKFGGHPKALYFESLLLSVMCNMGILGIIIWFAFVISYIKTVNFYVSDKFKRTILFSLLLLYLTYTGITGDYGYLILMAVFYVFVMGYSYSKDKINKNE